MKFFNNIIKTVAGAALLFAAACSPDDHSEINPAERPSASDIQVEISVDQNTDSVTFTLLNEGCTPVWYFEDGTKSTVNGLTLAYLTAGTYSVEVRMYNANGVTEGSVVKEFTINQTLLSFDTQIKQIASDEGKVWMVAHDKAGHLACGPSLDDPASWYSAAKEEKATTGLYDDTFTFYTDGTYEYNPGAGADCFVNAGTTVFGTHSEDATIPGIEKKTGTWKLEYRGTDLYLVLSKEMLLGYLAFDGLYESPEFYIASCTSKKLQLVATPGDNSIFWQYILEPYSESTSGNDDSQLGYKYDSDCNMWKSAEITTETYYRPNWGDIITTNKLTSTSNQSYTITLPTATNDQWQAQNKFHTSMSCNSATNYDFSIVLRGNQDHGAVTVKLTQDGDDGNFFFAEKVQLKADEDYVFMMTDMKGIDAEKLMLVLDFGWNPDNFECVAYDIVFKEHSCDDGTVIKDKEPEVNPADNIDWNYSSDANMLKGAYKDPKEDIYYAPDWNVLSTYTITAGANNSYTFTLPSATYQQWQAQLHLIPEADVATSAANKYDFHCVINSSTDIAKATIKLVDASEAGIFYFAETVKLEAGEDYEFGKAAMDGLDIAALKVVFDFGGNPDNTVVKVSDIILQQSTSK